MLGNIKNKISTILILLIFAAPLAAEQKAYQTEVGGNAESLKQHFKSFETGALTGSALKKKKINLRVFIPELGSVDIHLQAPSFKSWSTSTSNELESKEDKNNFALHNGVLKIKRGAAKTLAVSGVSYSRNRRSQLKINFFAKSASKKLKAYEVRIFDDKAGGFKSHFKRVPLSVLSQLSCANHSAAEAHIADSLIYDLSDTSKPATAAAGTIKVLNIATDADTEWFRLFGAASNAEAAAVINAADIFFRNSIGVTFKIINQNVQSGTSQPYTDSDPFVLLPQFKDYTNRTKHLGDADLYHLFSGKDFAGDTVGLAYLGRDPLTRLERGVVCSDPLSSYGISQFISSLHALTFAHEIGHNFGAQHDTVSALPGIMNPVVGPGFNQFSAFSQTQMLAQVTKFGDLCLDTVEDTGPGSVATPSAATPTTVPGPGIINNPGSNGVTGQVTLKTSYSAKKGTLKIENAVTAISGADCAIDLVFSSDKDFKKQYKRRVSDGGLILSVNNSATLANPVGFKKKQDKLIYMFSVYSCKDTASVASSALTSFKAGGKSRSLPALSKDKWLKKIVSKIKS